MSATSYTPQYDDTTTPHVEVMPRTGRRVSWGAVFAGVMIVLAIQLLLSMLGLGIGLGTINPAAGSTPNASSLGIGAAAWWGVSYLIALVAGGYVAARLAPSRLSFDGALHGLVTWAFALLLTFYLLTTALGGVIGGAFLGVYPGLDFQILPIAFAVVIIGGMGSLTGAAIGALVVGLADNFGKALFPEVSYFTLYAPMALLLAVKPTGLFGRE